MYTKTDLKEISPDFIKQLSFFKLLGAQDADYSNAVDFYDHIPKFVDNIQKRYWTYSEVKPQESTEFKYNYCGSETTFIVSIKPGRIIKDIDGKKTDVLVYPSIQREEPVYDALRKLATSDNGAFFDGELGTLFTLRMLQKELKRFKKTFSIPEIIESLQVLRRSEIEVSSIAGNFKWEPSFLSNLMLVSRQEIESAGSQIRCIAVFDSLVSNAVKALDFREHNYAIPQSVKSPIARYLIKRMDRRYKQASPDQPYVIKLSTVFKSIFKPIDKRMSNNTRYMNKAIEEMKEKRRVKDVEVEPVKHHTDKRKISDYLYKFYPHDDLISDMKRFNKKQASLKKQQLSLQLEPIK
ncbi:hypothetical protein [Zooshikella harenae]|uniref:Replication protein n=1 Tax=Zooshikella harenae TaxID=2827238 RepID=A0ABS5ZK12_9GAMM|nr:hypothetical protein [Zooshikella harenae]MBU2714153.1 hypothetical protein [Zooshikella harenae]